MREVTIFTLYAGTRTGAGAGAQVHAAATLRRALSAAGILGATISRGEGIYCGEREPSLRVDVIAARCEGNRTRDMLERVAAEYALEEDQREVWISERDARLTVVRGAERRPHESLASLRERSGR